MLGMQTRVWIQEQRELSMLTRRDALVGAAPMQGLCGRGVARIARHSADSFWKFDACCPRALTR